MTQTLNTYTAYKDSGIEWLGEIPEHWEIKRIKDACNMQSGFYINSNHFKDKGYSVFGGNGFRGYSKDYNHNGEYILIGRQGALCGNVNYAKGKFWATEHAIVIYERKEIQQFWFGELLRNMNLNQYSLSAAQPGLSVEKIKRLKIPLPPKKEQTQIAAYLDYKTSAIDKKITLLQQKITQYKAYRKSIINEVVTGKRLVQDGATIPIAKKNTKDSGISWIGKIPKHWEVKRIKDIFSISRGRVIGKTELKINGHYPVYSSQTKNNGILGYINTYDFNDDLLTWTTDGVNAGTVFMRKGKFNCTNICGALIPKTNSKLSLNYMEYAVQESTTHNKRIDTNGAKIMSNEMAVIRILFPPKKEQQQIATYLDTTTTIIDKIINNIETQISTLQELRKTLINDVVTGKVNVLHTQEANAAGKSYEEETEIDRKLNTLRRI